MFRSEKPNHPVDRAGTVPQEGRQMKHCPCCSEQLVLSIHNKRLYWFCSRCNRELAILYDGKTNPREKSQSIKPLNPLGEEAICRRDR